MIKDMNNDNIIFAMANPVRKIDLELTKKKGALLVPTKSADYPNQINNALAFRGIFRGLLMLGLFA